MKIIPLSDLRNTAAVSKLIDENKIIYVTKQGREYLTMLSHEQFENMERENKDLKLYIKVLNAEIEQLKNGNKSRPFDEFIEELKNES